MIYGRLRRFTYQAECPRPPLRIQIYFFFRGWNRAALSLLISVQEEVTHIV